MFNYEEILNALKVIKSICKNASDCSKCPLGNSNGDCMLRDAGIAPEEYDLINLEEEQVVRLIIN